MIPKSTSWMNRISRGPLLLLQPRHMAEGSRNQSRNTNLSAGDSILATNKEKIVRVTFVWCVRDQPFPVICLFLSSGKVEHKTKTNGTVHVITTTVVKRDESLCYVFYVVFFFSLYSRKQSFTEQDTLLHTGFGMSVSVFKPVLIIYYRLVFLN